MCCYNHKKEYWLVTIKGQHEVVLPRYLTRAEVVGLFLFLKLTCDLRPLRWGRNFNWQGQRDLTVANVEMVRSECTLENLVFWNKITNSYLNTQSLLVNTVTTKPFASMHEDEVSACAEKRRRWCGAMEGLGFRV